MSLEETTQFLEDLFVRFDPDIDLTEGSRAQVELIQPILDRIGIDPFDQDIATFVRERVRQQFPDLALTDVDALTDTVIDPMRVLAEPLVREVKLVKLRSSLRNVESISDDEVDALMSNFFEGRRSGGFAQGVVRAFFSNPISVTATLVNPAFGPGGLRFFPTTPQQITADTMLLNQSGTEFYWDILYTAERRGDEYNVEEDQITSIANFPSAVRVTNLRRFRDGAPRETSLSYVARVSQKLSDRTLTVIRGVLSELFDNFPTLEKIQVIGFGDAEMKRDIVRGGGMGTIADDEMAYGSDGVFPDDGDGDATTQLFDAPTGDFVARIGSVGDDPGDTYLTVVYNDLTAGIFVIRDTKITEIISSTRVRIEDEIPVGAVPTGLATTPWALRRRLITLSDIPGGITLPDRIDGTLEINDDEIHIGGKTDIYVGGPIDEETAQIDSLTDESPLSRGVDARTGQDPANLDIIYLPEATPAATSLLDLEVGMSFVLEEGADIGSYLIREIDRTSPTELRLRVNVEMTGIQTDLAWKIVDDIDTTLTEPKDIKVEGSDLVTVAGNTSVTTLGGTNFVDANVQNGDILRLNDDTAGGDFTVQVVGPSALTISPAPTRSISGGDYLIFRLGEETQTPVVRIRSLELLDSAGAPVGTTIPYRDPVLAESRAFQNQGSENVFEGPARVGLVTIYMQGAAGLALFGGTLDFRFYDPEIPHAGEIGSYVFTFTTPNPVLSGDMVAEINADATLNTFGVRASRIVHAGRDYVGIFCQSLIRIAPGGIESLLYAADPSAPAGAEVSNAMLNSMEDQALYDARVRETDVVEFLEGENSGFARLLHLPLDGPALVFPHRYHVTLGNGPLGPRSTTQTLGRLYNNRVLVPEVGTNIKIGRPSIGSTRMYYLEPTSAEFDYRDMEFEAVVDGETLKYTPDPENLRVIQPPPPLTELPDEGTLTATTLTDTSVDFLAQGIKEGDIIEALFFRIVSAGPALPLPPTTLSTAGTSFIISLDNGPFITLSFPSDFTVDQVVEYINDQLGQTIAFHDGAGFIYLKADVKIELDATATSLVVLQLTNDTINTHPSEGSFIVAGVTENVLTLSLDTPATGTTTNTQYRIRRYLQRISSTEMNDNVDESGLYFADIELISTLPGNRFNIPSQVDMSFIGQRGDGFRLSTDNDVLSFSRAEVLRAEISRTILLVGSSDSPEEYVQLSQQNVQVNYDRSELTDSVQSFIDSDLHRVTTQEGLARHLFPHFINTNWQYVGGDLEVSMRRALEDVIDDVDADEELEVGDLVSVLRRRGAISVFSPDPDSPAGRIAPLFVVVYHEADRTVRAIIVRDQVSTSRTKRMIPDTLGLSRVSSTGPRF